MMQSVAKIAANYRSARCSRHCSTPGYMMHNIKVVMIVVACTLNFILSVRLAFSAAASLHLIAADAQIDALLELKSNVQDPIGHLDGWIVPLPPLNHSITPCSWNGVLCRYYGRPQLIAVVSLNLAHMNLSGTISPKIGRLQKLVNLSLAANNLSGVVPGEVCDIGHSLRYFNISNNLLSGTFPANNLSNFASLEVLDAYNNLLEGPLPLQLSKLSRMRHLHLGGNFFNGSIPPEYGGMHSLVYLGLSGNLLTGRIPVQLGNLVLLEQLYMGYDNQYEGGIPASLGCLTRLIVLDLAQCSLNGSILPRLLQNLTKLESLLLYTNSLSGPIPPEIGNLMSLKFLDLSDNRLSGRIPPQISKLVNLELLHLFRNQISGGIPSSIGDLPNLQNLSLWQNKMVGRVPERLGSNDKLLSVDLSSNSLTGPLPLGLCSGHKLEVVILFNNLVTGTIPESLASCTSLKRVRLGRNQLSGSIPWGLLGLPWLQMMEVPDNQLSGRISNNISIQNYQLGRLDLSHNQLSGVIPVSIGNLMVLEALLLKDNLLHGPIPPEISRLKRLSKLDLSGNSIGGVIPATLGDCVDLTYLDLSRNQLVDGIPSELHTLQVLNFLNLSRNRLTGSIPPSLQLMQTLTSADFSYNNLSGPIPVEGQFAAFNASFFIGNAALCGSQLQITCSGSSSANLSSYDRVLRKIQKGPAVMYWAIVGVMSSLTAMVLLLAVFYNYRHAICAFLRKNDMTDSSNSASTWKLTAFEKLDFTANHVLACLTDDNVIGKGGSGTVYKCATPSGYVAVKRLPSLDSGGSVLRSSSSYTFKSSKLGCSVAVDDDHDNQLVMAAGFSGRDDHGFSAEIETLGKIRHRNIVRLLGCCSSRATNLLVYEYMPNGSLGELLHGPRAGGTSTLLDWGKRYRIAVDAANGLRYLHHHCSPLIVHRDVKSNNILLDSKFEAHVSDFGLAKPLNNIQPESMSSVAGSYGYIAPEYVYTLKVDEKSDIYSFGIVLLELLTGRRPLEPEYGEGVDIAHWVRKKAKSKQGVVELVDPRLGPILQHTMAEEVMLLLRVALLCLSELPVQRPTMQDVVHMLESARTRGPPA